MLIDLSFWQIFARVVSAIIILTCHGAVMSLVAGMLGDRGPRYDGRSRLSPVAQVPLLAVVTAVLGRAGWVKPIVFEPGKMRFGAGGLILCLVGGIATIFLLGVLALWLRPLAVSALPPSQSVGANSFLLIFAEIAFWFVLFSLLPVPPLTAGYLILAIAPAFYAALLRHIGALSLIVAVALFGAELLGVQSWLRSFALRTIAG